MFRYKALIGPRLRTRTLPAQESEARITCAVINRMTPLGRPRSQRVRSSYPTSPQFVRNGIYAPTPRREPTRGPVSEGASLSREQLRVPDSRHAGWDENSLRHHPDRRATYSFLTLLNRLRNRNSQLARCRFATQVRSQGRVRRSQN